jgi:hypothetical protein
MAGPTNPVAGINENFAHAGMEDVTYCTDISQADMVKCVFDDAVNSSYSACTDPCDAQGHVRRHRRAVAGDRPLSA